MGGAGDHRGRGGLARPDPKGALEALGILRPGLGIDQPDRPLADDETATERLAGKVARLRIFENEAGKFDRSLADVGGAALVVSQFTLIADSKRQKGTRPDFSGAAPREQAEPLYKRFCAALRELGVPVATGVFGARMVVEIVNDGPVTIVLDVQARPQPEPASSRDRCESRRATAERGQARATTSPTSILSIVTAGPAGGCALSISAAACAASSDSKVSMDVPVVSSSLTHCALTKPGACEMRGMPSSFRVFIPCS